MDKRKILLIGLALVLVLALVAGCGEQAEPPDNGNDNGNGDPVAEMDALEMANLITAEWQESGKQFAISYAAGRSGRDCASCHDGYGFSVKDEIDFTTQWNPGGADENMETNPEHLTGIGCQACHTGAGLGYMESGSVELPYATIDNAGQGAACMFCHSGRRDTAAALEQYAAGEATRFTYPHYGPASVLTAEGLMEYPEMEYASSSAHANIEDSCVSCHMPETEDGYASHTFVMDVAYIDQTCGSCHDGIENYNYKGYQDNVKAMLDQLKAAIFEETGAVDLYSERGQLVFEGPDGEPLSIEQVSTEAFVAGYNYYGIKYEGSYGVHNPQYTNSIIKNSYKALTGEDME
ncbi:MAG: ammonia-forming cytochrome c nitrite reductase subunit c552 [Bacillota bacterium]|nr:ammonia-forming cytochrome c nitrite reductase subunit c552 [Bacillota bacterium]MDW7682634.1 ammonia-forming cytochrome c nitrite reductase subunit c552 [Bacillota bacterium]